MWELNRKQGWVMKNWCFWTVVLEKTLESPFNSKKIKPVNPNGNQSWIFIGRTDAEAEAPILWPPDVKSWLTGKDSDAGRDWGQEEKGVTQDEMAGWHHWLNGHESEWTSGTGDGQGGLVCCDSWGRKELDTTEWLNKPKKHESISCNTRTTLRWGLWLGERLYLGRGAKCIWKFSSSLFYCEPKTALKINFKK